MTTDTTERRIELPKPLYAAAGAGELAYQRLRRLPEFAVRTMRTASQTAEQLRARLGEEGDLADRLRATASRGTALGKERAARAKQRASASYQELVARGERVVATRLGARERDEASQVEVIVGPVSRDERPSAQSGGQAAPDQPTGEAGSDQS